MTITYTRQGKVHVEGGDIWYDIVGNGDATPLITLHGGPGGSCSGLEPLADLADERPVVLYDQLGCGKSDGPNNPDLWRTDRFVAELRELIRSLGYDRLIAAMGDGFYRIYNNRAANEEELARLNRELFTRHFWRTNRSAEVLAQAEHDFGRDVFATMWGPNDFTITGTPANYERMDDLAAIRAPTLFACGRFDEATPEWTQLFAARVPNSQLAIFENSAHMPMYEERGRYIDTLRSFRRGVDAGETR